MRYIVEGTCACVLGVLLAWPGPASAERADRDKPMHVEADSVRMDDLQKIAVYEGKVVLSQGTLWLSADRIEVRQDDEGVSSGVALGSPVQFRQKLDGRGEWAEGRANRIEYEVRTEKLRLIGQAHLKKGDEELRGEIISYDAKNEFFQAGGGLPGQKPGRVRAVIMPPKKAQGGGSSPPAAGKQDGDAAPASGKP